MSDTVATKSTAKARRWCFTWNNYSAKQLADLHLISKDHYDYLIFGVETAPTTGTQHLQGYIEVKTPITMNVCKGRLDAINKGKSTIHIEPAMGSHDENREYCSKNGAYFEYINKLKAPGSRSDWTAIYADILEDPDYGKILAKYPEYAIKYHGGIDRAIRSVIADQMKNKLLARYVDKPLRPWQEEFLAEVQRPADDRKVVWYYDKTGKQGKTWISKYILALHKGAYFTNAKSADIAHAYNGEAIVIFDLSRTVEGKVNYQAIEQVKNGILFSPKYASATKVFDSPWVIIMANFWPDEFSLSQDRWDIRTLDQIKYDEKNMHLPLCHWQVNSVIEGDESLEDNIAPDDVQLSIRQAMDDLTRESITNGKLVRSDPIDISVEVSNPKAYLALSKELRASGISNQRIIDAMKDIKKPWTVRK